MPSARASLAKAGQGGAHAIDLSIRYYPVELVTICRPGSSYGNSLNIGICMCVVIYACRPKVKWLSTTHDQAGESFPRVKCMECPPLFRRNLS